jgi:hypothetical protein
MTHNKLATNWSGQGDGCAVDDQWTKTKPESFGLGQETLGVCGHAVTQPLE